MTDTRQARVLGGLGASIDIVRDYLPSNYTATEDADGILISGTDRYGWTLDSYVIPRLGSALIAVKEVIDTGTSADNL